MRGKFSWRALIYRVAPRQPLIKLEKIVKRSIGWDEGTWTNVPVRVVSDESGLQVTARKGSDAWGLSSYGVIHASEHALLMGMRPQSAMEVQFNLDLSAQFDQAGIFIRIDDETWMKAGVEIIEGQEHLGTVVTRVISDWSLSPVPEWSGRKVTIRCSRSGSALTIRARVADEPWRLIRATPLDPDATVQAGPFCCAPINADLTVHFISWRITPPDPALRAYI
ncbi:DUF1349 domain-containing protein [Arthrobacter agilis]|uniref:DUF1349 domain-containing protein n=1 Tax=Arthrobacter agilis TaxID=37921 RepID=A0A2L0UH29_9MICC|nr:DUF1349 domain-containing protein [Arthrobacter agilis]